MPVLEIHKSGDLFDVLWDCLFRKHSKDLISKKGLTSETWFSD